MSQGWVKLKRELLHACVMDNQDALTVYVYLMLTVNHKAADVTFPNCIKPIHLEPGQTITSLPVMASKAFKKLSYNDGINSVRRALKLLENFKMISVNSTNKYSIISICDWDTCESKEDEIYKLPTNQIQTNLSQPSGNPHAEYKLPTTNKNEENVNTGKKVKNEKKTEPFVFVAEDHHPVVAEQWAAWVAYKAERKQPYLPSSARTLVKHLDDKGPEWCAVAIPYTIGRGWAGIRHPNGEEPGTAKTDKPPPKESKPAKWDVDEIVGTQTPEQFDRDMQKMNDDFAASDPWGYVEGYEKQQQAIKDGSFKPLTLPTERDRLRYEQAKQHTLSFPR